MFETLISNLNALSMNVAGLMLEKNYDDSLINGGEYFINNLECFKKQLINPYYRLIYQNKWRLLLLNKCIRCQHEIISDEYPNATQIICLSQNLERLNVTKFIKKKMKKETIGQKIVVKKIREKDLFQESYSYLQ